MSQTICRLSSKYFKGDIVGVNQVLDEISCEEKKKVAYALNLCAVSISQIIDSKDIYVLKQEREAILNNINLQNFVKHPALFDALKHILNTITYLEIQAGDLSFIEKEYQFKLKNAIWNAIPSPGSLFVGGNVPMIALAVVSQVGTGYMNYRRNKSQYTLDKEKSQWELKRHELEQLYGLRAQLFETAWRLSEDYGFDDKFRLTEKQLLRYSEALLEENPLRRFERLDVMSDRFTAFAPFWYHKGNAAMEVFRGNLFGPFSAEYKNKAIEAYKRFCEHHFEFLREDVVAASCFIEYISLLDPGDLLIDELLRRALQLAGEDYDVLQQTIFVNIQQNRLDDVMQPLRELIVNNHNVGLNGILLSRIYLEKNFRSEYDKLCMIAGKENILPWTEDLMASEKILIESRNERIIKELREMAKRIYHVLINESEQYLNLIYKEFNDVLSCLKKYILYNKDIDDQIFKTKELFNRAIVDKNKDNRKSFFIETEVLCDLLELSKSLSVVDDTAMDIANKIAKIAKK